ncbi:MAG TPA: methyltransferase domain-containing protein [Allosphingosinicella sp.]|nr:methyltransferase domain-containing protein [Allosphingosinicella sp.]
MADPETDYSHEFIRAALPGSARRLLEIGCGSGALAERLKADGYEVVALDSDAGCVAEASRRGVDARLAAWPDFSHGLFDAVLFTRSLHHVRDLDASVAAAFACLAPDGSVIVEDFDAAFADETTFVWLKGLLRVLRAAGIAIERSDYLRGLLLPGGGDHREHHHDLHSAAAIDAALRLAARSVRTEPAAYFFRYVARTAPGRAPLIEALEAHELELIRTGRIAPLGRRWVAAR